MARTLIILVATVALPSLAADQAKSNVWSQLDVQIYGRLKADVSYDSSRVEPGDYVKWVTDSGQDDDETNITANETRLGLIIKGPQDGKIKTSGKVEVDFYGNGAAENKAEIMMRHGYVQIETPTCTILAGQTSDIISPLVPRTLNYSVLWWAGNMGYRRPQVRFTRQCELAKDVTVKVDAGITRTIGDTFLAEAGEDFGPTAQARVGLTVPGLDKKPLTVGISGHWGKEEYGNTEVATWSANIDATIPMDKGVTLKAEWFIGRNLDALLGGIGHGVRTSDLEGIDAKGGWVAAEIEPGCGWSLTGGVGMDNPDTEDLASGNRDLNRCIFGNAIYAINKNTKVGLEVSHWKTEFVGKPSVDDVRCQFSVIYEF